MSDIDSGESEEARQAWGRICRRGSAQFDDWITIGKVFVAARERCLKLAGTNRPYGRKYTALIGQWLRETNLDQICKAERGWLYLVMDSLDGIMRWRATLDEKRASQLNHPQAVLFHYRQSLGIAPRHRPKSEPRTIARPYVGQGVHWHQDAIRRAALAMKESRSSDWFVLARQALEAAIRNTCDIEVLLTPPSGRSAPQKMATAALHAPS
jgi:hypothetical protein